MIERIFEILAPIFLIVLVGYAYGRWKNPPLDAINAANMDVFTPILVISVFATRSIHLSDYIPITVAGILVTLLPGLGALVIARLLKLQWKTFVPPMMFKNSGNYGIPLLLFTFGEEALPAIIMLFIVENTLHFTLGTWMVNPRANVIQVLVSPIVIATFIGLGLSLFEVTLPSWLVNAIELAGAVPVPLMLFALGVRLVQMDLSAWRIGVLGAVASPLLGMLAVIPITLLISLNPTQHNMLWLFAALPPAVLNYLVAERYKQQPDQVAAIVVFANAASIVIMPVVLYFVLSG